ncbi:MAG: type IV pilus twitching motility protein PilT [Oscillospiraceae bacterium]|nr:type IV pilus twitching motility protein PilT [Oscillospiraceae bacterium]
MENLKEILYRALEQDASDLHMTVGLPPVYRIDGQLINYGDKILVEEDIAAAVRALANDNQMAELKKTGECDFAVTYDGTIRMRCNAFYQQGNTALALRMLPLKVPTVESLGLAPIIVEQAKKPRGLVLLTGPTGSGKSSTLAALLDYINHNYRRHIITLENPIEFVYEHDQCIINQREVGDDTGSFAAGLRAALRQDPDVILVGEMRDLETISTAITAAETGHLVFGTLHTKGAANTIDRIIDVFPPAQQEQIRIQLADVLECVIAKALLPAIGGGREAAYEILVATPAVRSLIRQNKSFQITSAMQTGKRQGMQLLDDALADLVRQRKVALDVAETVANDPAAMRASIGRF